MGFIDMILVVCNQFLEIKKTMIQGTFDWPYSTATAATTTAHATAITITTRNTCTQQPLARLPNLFSVMLRLHTAI